MKKFFLKIFTVLLLTAIQPVLANEPRAIHQQEHLDALSVFKKNADDYVSKNLNRFGLNQLQNYNAALDTMYSAELNDTVQSFKTNYEQSHLTRSKTIKELNSQISDLTVKKENAKTGFTGLLRKAGIAALLWLVIVLVLIQIRNRALKRMQAKLDISIGQLTESGRRVAAGRELLMLGHENETRFSAWNESASNLQKVFSETQLTEENGFSKEESDRLKASVGETIRTATVNHKIIEMLLTQELQAAEEKVSTNLNQLCDQCFELVYNGMKSADPDLKISVSKDLEKNLPQLRLVPEAVVQLLINVLINAFQSVKARQEKKIKGYVPKVTISTRVLPRFLQVRVHDNGEGMTDEIIQKSGEPYFTLKSSSHASGLGLYFAKKIAGEMHQGELKIESEPGNKTDVYLKFFTS